MSRIGHASAFLAVAIALSAAAGCASTRAAERHGKKVSVLPFKDERYSHWGVDDQSLERLRAMEIRGVTEDGRTVGALTAEMIVRRLSKAGFDAVAAENPQAMFVVSGVLCDIDVNVDGAPTMMLGGASVTIRVTVASGDRILLARTYTGRKTRIVPWPFLYFFVRDPYAGLKEKAFCRAMELLCRDITKAIDAAPAPIDSPRGPSPI